ncbi:MAG: hypothetical protein MZU95_02900 [Desulfomicrobium escambiense]|nr:hypothetical protein [Desulfomicrobium escambiense]
MAFTGYFGMLFGPGWFLLPALRDRFCMPMGAAERVFGILDTPEAVTDSPDASGSGPNPRGHIEFRDVCFAYPGGNPVLSGVSFSVAPGETVAIFG